MSAQFDSAAMGQQQQEEEDQKGPRSRLQLLLTRKMSMRSRRKSPISPLQFDSHTSRDSFSSNSWSSTESSINNGSLSTATSSASHHYSIADHATESSPSYPPSLLCPLTPPPPPPAAAPTNAAPLPPPAVDISCFLYKSHPLRSSMHKASLIQKRIKASGAKLADMTLRLPALDLAMAPLQSDAEDARELCNFIDQTTGPALAVLEAFQRVRELAPTIEAGPSGGQDEEIWAYLGQVSSLESLLAFVRGNSSRVVQLLHGAVETLGRSRAVDKLSLYKLHDVLSALRPSHDQLNFGAALLENAAANLEAHFIKLLTQDAIMIQLGTAPCEAEALMPEVSLHVLKEIARKLSSEGRLKKCLSIYEKIRGDAVRKSLKTLGASAQYLRHSTPEAVGELEWEALEDHIATWAQQMDVVIKVVLSSERKLISDVFNGFDNKQWEVCFSRLALKGALQHWLKFGKAVARSRGEPQKLFKLLDMFECLENLRPVVEEEVLVGDACNQARRQVANLQMEVVKGACKVFRAFGSQVEGDWGAAPPPNGGVLKLASYVVNYVKCLLSESYKPVLGMVLRAERAWRGSADGDQSSQLTAAILHLMQALERNVEAKARGLQEAHPALGQLFLMNNHWYIYTRAKNSELVALLDTPWLTQHKQRAEKCAVRYRREAWGALLGTLSQDGLALSAGGGGASRGLLRQRLLDFEAAFLALHRRHQHWSVPDPVLRHQLGTAVIQSLVPTLSAFFRQFAPLLPKSEQIEYPPRRMQQMIAALFELPDQDIQPHAPPPPPPPPAAPASLRSFDRTP